MVGLSMAAVGEPPSRSPFLGQPHHFGSGLPKTLPILPVSPLKSTDESMEPSQAAGPVMPPPTRSNSNEDNIDDRSTPPSTDHPPHHSSNGSPAPAVGAAAAAQQPKVVQTAFIHKLYSMLEDQSIQHLISWSSHGEKFVMLPSSEFSKVLAQYFKHTNISSFVRQLNMYGFQKEREVFHGGAPDSPFWEFKHGQGNFKRGDLVGLRDIKRRASRHTLIHRDSFSNAPKLAAPLPAGAPTEPLQPSNEPIEARFQMLEWTVNDLSSRLLRTEEAYYAATSRCRTLMTGLERCHHWNHELSSHILGMLPDPDNPIHRDVFAMRQSISRSIEQLKGADDPQDAPKPNHFALSGMPVEPSIPMSPRQRPFDDSRRPSLQSIGKSNAFRPVPSHLQVSPRRYGSIGANTGLPSPVSSRFGHLPPPPLPPPQQQHQVPDAAAGSVNLARRHTSADISSHGWQGAPGQHVPGSSPYASGQSSSGWPSSPHTAAQQEGQQLRDVLAQYELPRASIANAGNAGPPANPSSRQTSPRLAPVHETGGASNGAPPTVAGFNGSAAPYANPSEAGWQLPGPRYSIKGLETPGSQTRRSSMASNVHSLLNPAHTAEREGEDEGPEERKRKRLT